MGTKLRAAAQPHSHVGTTFHGYLQCPPPPGPVALMEWCWESSLSFRWRSCGYFAGKGCYSGEGRDWVAWRVVGNPFRYLGSEGVFGDLAAGLPRQGGIHWTRHEMILSTCHARFCSCRKLPSGMEWNRLLRSPCEWTSVFHPCDQWEHFYCSFYVIDSRKQHLYVDAFFKVALAY